MGMLIIRHKVKDYNKWRPPFLRKRSDSKHATQQSQMPLLWDVPR